MDDGKVFFVECSNKFMFNETWFDLLESRSNGLIMSLNPKTQATTVIVEKLFHPVSLTSIDGDEMMVLSEPGHYNLKFLEYGSLDLDI